jgi:cell shape-determining protein MreD
MEFSIFIAPATLIVVELFKKFGVSSKYLALIAVVVGLLFGAVYGFVYGFDVFTYAVQGFFYGASSSGIYDVVTKTIKGA